MKKTLPLVFVLAALTYSHVTAATSPWQPPVGIPAPSFGITQTAPLHSPVWTVPTVGYFYVDATSAASTDTSNPYGTPSKPRQTIPTALPAGSVVELHGTYSYDHTSPRGIVSSGSAAAPVFIRGVSATARPVVTSCWEMTGSYYIVENIEFSTCGGIVLLGPTDHGALRHSDVHGTVNGGGAGVVSWTGDPATDVVLWDNLIHDNGDMNATNGLKSHGIAVGDHISNLWVVDNQMYRNSGDGIQINAGSAALQATTHHLYIGRNISHDNKQTGFWTKQAVDVIFSQNASYSHRPSNTSMGACMGGQYAPEEVWFIDNVMWDCDYGIQLADDNGLGTGHLLFVIGNIMINIHDSIGGFQPGSAWQNCGVSLPGGTLRYVIENDIYDVDSGVCVPNQSGALYLFDNLVEGISTEGHHLMYDSAVMAGNTIAAGNLFAPNYTLGIGGETSVMPPQPRGVVGSNGVVADIGWVSPATDDFQLQATSPAIGYGTMNQLGIWAYFTSRYGTVLSIDKDGVPRPTSPPLNSGALAR